jgi:hypothetical protein
MARRGRGDLGANSALRWNNRKNARPAAGCITRQVPRALRCSEAQYAIRCSINGRTLGLPIDEFAMPAKEMKFLSTQPLLAIQQRVLQ